MAQPLPVLPQWRVLLACPVAPTSPPLFRVDDYHSTHVVLPQRQMMMDTVPLACPSTTTYQSSLSHVSHHSPQWPHTALVSITTLTLLTTMTMTLHVQVRGDT